MKRLAVLGAVVLLVAPTAAQERPATPRLGSSYQTPETQALQADEAANPGMLWVEQGAHLWSTGDKSCASCHGDVATAMRGVAARYPRVDASGTVVSVEGQINRCRSERQGAAALAYESNDLLALTAVVAFQSRGVPRRIETNERTTAVLARARSLFEMRQGQLNLSCANCHVELEGRKLRGDTISQGQTHGWPAYRLEWQTMGSLHRRLRACSLGVRAEVLDFGHPDYLALELYLAWRGEGLPLESPGIRR